MNNSLATVRVLFVLAAVLLETGLVQAQRQEPTTRRSERVVPMEEVRVSSPDAGVEFVLDSNPERLSFTVTLGDSAVLDPSAIAMRVDGYDLSSGVVFLGLERYQMDETYRWHGAHGTATNRCNGARVRLQNDLTSVELTLDVRAFDDGVAYRLIVPGEDGEARVPDENSTFVLPAGTTIWYHGLGGHYEAEYREEEISEVEAGRWAGPPVTFRLPEGAGFGSITEANLVNYSGMALEADGRGAWTIGLGHRQPLNYPFELRYGREEGRRLGRPAAIEGTITTPWRAVMIGRDLNALVSSDLLPNLCPPPDPELFPEGIETSWVEPGLAVWDYVDRGYGRQRDGDRFERMKEFSRMGGEIGAKYHILEGFAYRWSDEEIREFVDYSNEQGVRTLFWRHSRDLRTPESREEFFSRLARLGVAGAKIDFFDHEAKEVVDHYEELLEAAARHKLVVNFHGANKPTGRTRTWPNELVREAVRGMESSRLRARARHETILPFTRYLAGPADYTTMIFTERRQDSSWAHQIACLATLDSPLLTIAAHPQSVLDNPALEVIRSIKPVWDETIVLPESRVGELSIFARRSGPMWLLAVMSAGPARTIEVPLSFLGEGEHEAVLVADNLEEDGAVRITNRKARRSDTMTIALRPGGGFVGRFTNE